MKRITAVILALVMCLSLSACGQTDAAKAAQKAISQIGTVTESSESAITDAENLFNHLTEEEKPVIRRMQWFSVDQIKHCNLPIYPTCLAELIESHSR